MTLDIRLLLWHNSARKGKIFSNIFPRPAYKKVKGKESPHLSDTQRKRPGENVEKTFQHFPGSCV